MYKIIRVMIFIVIALMISIACIWEGSRDICLMTNNETACNIMKGGK